MQTPILTIFTPTYNRKSLLARVYQSLLEQTGREFIWLIVDDGSTDGTKARVAEWIRENRLQISYYYQENGGKMRAHNLGVRRCKTKLFVCLDSDDYFTKTAVEDIINTYKERLLVKSPGRRLAGIAAHKGETTKRVLYDARFPELEYSTLGNLYRRGFAGETTLVFWTKVLKRFPFPEIDGERYVPEDYVYDQIDQEYELYILPKILTVCEIVKSGYTDKVRELREENPLAFYLYYRQRAELTRPSWLKLKYISHLLCFGRLLKKNIRQDSTIGAFWIMLGIPGAVLLLLAGKR